MRASLIRMTANNEAIRGRLREQRGGGAFNRGPVDAGRFPQPGAHPTARGRAPPLKIYTNLHSQFFFLTSP